MSSILEALKKAELESAADQGARTPWPAPSPGQSADRPMMRRWWLLVGIIGFIVILAVVAWQTRRADTERSDSAIVGPPPDPQPRREAAPPLAEQMPAIAQTLKPQNDWPPTEGLSAADAQRTALPTTATKIRPHEQTTMVVGTTPVPKLPPHPDLPAPKAADPSHLPADAPSQVPKTASTPIGSTGEASAEDTKTYRHDPRIDLQALVWAPEAAGRFVVINNRLIKEGGALDDIVVVEINPDDVILAEGADRWREAFTVR